LWWTVAAAAKRNRPHSIVPWNIGSRVALVYMHKSEPLSVDLMLGSVILGFLLAVIFTGIVGVIA
jgi:hypothetical protein